MIEKGSDLQKKHLRLTKPYLDSRGNLYLAKDYLPFELPLNVIEKANVKVISVDELNSFTSDFTKVTNIVPEQKVDVQVRSLSNKKKTPSKPPEILDMNPIEALDPTK